MYRTLIAIVSVAGTACAQCIPEVLPGYGVPGISINPYVGSGPRIWASCMWDPDGPGPKGPVLVVAGAFHAIGNTKASNIAYWDGTAWHPLGSGTDTSIYGIAPAPNGDLVVGGDFKVAGGAPALRVARWDGSNWHPMGAGFSQDVITVAVRPNGEIFAGGFAPHSRWDGTQWIGTGFGTRPYASTIAQNGDLIVAGGVTYVPGRCARWDGETWTVLGSSSPFAPVARSVIETASGDILIGVENTDGVLKVVGDTFVTLAPGMGFTGLGIAEISGGRLIATGGYSTLGRRIAMYDDSAWHSMGGGISTNHGATVTALPSGGVVVGGWFFSAGELPASNIAFWNEGQWSSIGPGFDDRVRCILPLSDGRVAVGGSFRQAGPTPAAGVALLDGDSWLALGSGMTAGRVHALAEAPNGDLIATGYFSASSGAPSDHIARWDGTAWQPLGTGLNAEGLAVAAMPNGDVVVGGKFSVAGGVSANRLARWDGSSWSAFPVPTSVSVINALAVHPNGDLYVGGEPKYIARWNGSEWSALGTGVNGTVTRLLIDQQGHVIAGGTFSSAGGTGAAKVARWDGNQWHAMGNPQNFIGRALSLTSNGDLIGAVQPNYHAHSLVRWDGSAWNVFADTDYHVDTVAERSNGELLIGGNFIEIGGKVSAYFARYGCPPAPGCYANCDGSTTAPVLNVADFGCFLGEFASGDPYANCDGSTVEPVLNVADFGCFLSKFAAGCP